ncbi:MAG: hypothetical protein HUJ61_03955 [Bacilli bacterium]|nr:hypothetical protein [Bacilli bacterium]
MRVKHYSQKAEIIIDILFRLMKDKKVYKKLYIEKYGIHDQTLYRYILVLRKQFKEYNKDIIIKYSKKYKYYRLAIQGNTLYEKRDFFAEMGLFV